MGREDEQTASHVLSRRQVLRGGAVVFAGLGMSPLVLLSRRADAAPGIGFAPVQLPPDLITTVRRREDLLDLRFEFFNLRLVSDASGTSLVRRNGNAAAYLAVVLPSQALAERAFADAAQPGQLGHGHPDNPASELLGVPPIDHRFAGESRLAFTVPAELESIPYTLESLLTWTLLEPRLVPVASGQPDPQPPGQLVFGSPVPQIREPGPFETAIELPWRLILSPHAGLGWAHATGLVTRNGRTEVWHTRLGVRSDDDTVDEWDASPRTVRAVWTPDRTDPKDPFLSSLDSSDRQQIVEASSTYAPAVVPDPVDVDRLMLTPLGGWLDSRGAWEPALGSSLEEWRHLATMGRDHYVRVVERGYLFPYGHRASLVKITERRFDAYDGSAPPGLFGQQGAYLRQRLFLLVRQPLKRYGTPADPDAAVGQPNQGRGWPLGRLRFTTLATPILDAAAPQGALGVAGAFVPTVGQDPFLFHVLGTDLEGRQVDLTTPVVFVPSGVAFEAGSMGGLVAAFNDLAADDPLRWRDLSGQKVALAERVRPGDTTMDLGGFVLGAAAAPADLDDADLHAHDQPRFYPTFAEFTARLSGAEQASGHDLGVPRFELFAPYVQGGFGDANLGGVFAAVVGDGVGVGFEADRAGGLMTPNVDVGAMSRELGAVGGTPAQIQADNFDPKDVFAAGAAKLLGGIDLADIIRAASISTDPDKAMSITTRPEFGDGETQPPTASITELHWEPDLQPDSLGLFDPWSTANQPTDPRDASLLIEAIFRQDVQPERSTYEIEGDLRDFRLNLVGSGDATRFMIVTFEQLRFTARSGEKTDIEVGIDRVDFAGPLQFVNEIREYLTFGGSGPFIDLQPSGVTAGYQLALPQIPLGMLMFNNIAMSAALHIPFSGAPARIRFGLSSRENPFDVTYSAIGGGGYFGIAFGLDGLETFECAVELGAYLSMDFGVASGSICLVAGICFELDFVQGTENVALTAYIRFSGKVTVLGLIGLSLEIYLGLTFEPTPPKLTGRAWAELEVKVLFFSGSVRVEIERKISATPNDPTFADLFDEEHWDEYALAFA